MDTKKIKWRILRRIRRVILRSIRSVIKRILSIYYRYIPFKKNSTEVVNNVSNTGIIT